MTLYPFDCYFNNRDVLDSNLVMALSSDSPFDDMNGLPYVYSPFSFDSNFGNNKKDDGFGTNGNEFLTNPSTRTLTVPPPSNSGITGTNSPRSGFNSIGQNGGNVIVNNQPSTTPPISIGNNSPFSTTSNNTNNMNPITTTTSTTTNLQPTLNTAKEVKIKKKKTIIKLKTKKGKKSKKNKGPAYPGARFEDVFTNNDLQNDFSKFLKKKANENDLKFLISVKRFEDETGDIHSRAMNICFEFLGVGGGGLLVSVENSVVSELSTIIRNRQSSKEMFNRAKQIVDGVVRNKFTEFIG